MNRPTTPVPRPDPAEAGLTALREIARWTATLARLSPADLAAALRLYSVEASPVDAAVALGAAYHVTAGSLLVALRLEVWRRVNSATVDRTAERLARGPTPR